MQARTSAETTPVAAHHADVAEPVAADPAVRDLLLLLVDAIDDRAAVVVDERLAVARADGEAGRPGRYLDAGLALGSLGLGVAATAVAWRDAVAVTVLWIAIAVVNVAYARRR